MPSPNGKFISFLKLGPGKPAVHIIRRQTDGTWGNPELFLTDHGNSYWLTDSAIVAPIDGRIDMKLLGGAAVIPF